MIDFFTHTGSKTDHSSATHVNFGLEIVYKNSLVLLRHLCYDLFAVILLLWHLCFDTSALTLLLWHVCCDTSAMKRLLWHVCEQMNGYLIHKWQCHSSQLFYTENYTDTYLQNNMVEERRTWSRFHNTILGTCYCNESQHQQWLSVNVFCAVVSSAPSFKMSPANQPKQSADTMWNNSPYWLLTWIW